MTSTPAPDPTAPPSPRDLSRIVDELEERTAAEAARDRRPEEALPEALPDGSLPDDAPSGGGAATDAGGRDRDEAREVPGAIEPPD